MGLAVPQHVGSSPDKDQTPEPLRWQADPLPPSHQEAFLSLAFKAEMSAGPAIPAPANPHGRLSLAQCFSHLGAEAQRSRLRTMMGTECLPGPFCSLRKGELLCKHL